MTPPTVWLLLAFSSNALPQDPVILDKFIISGNDNDKAFEDCLKAANKKGEHLQHFDLVCIAGY